MGCGRCGQVSVPVERSLLAGRACRTLAGSGSMRDAT